MSVKRHRYGVQTIFIKITINQNLFLIFVVIFSIEILILNITFSGLAKVDICIDNIIVYCNLQYFGLYP